MSNLKVAIAGASGGIGQPLALLMKHVTNISQLVLYDIKNCVGVATDLSHIETTVSIKGYNGAKTVVDALKGSDIILMVAGVPRKPNMTRDDLFNMNASTVRDLTRAMAKAAPKALLAIVTNPINTVVPIACEVLRKAGAFDRSRVFGVTTLDLVRASTFVGQDKKMDPKKVHIPCIGGHSGPTIIPVFSQAKPQLSYPKEKIVAFTKRIKTAGTEVVKAKGAGSATLSTAYATARFANALIRGMTGEKNVIECAYVRSDVAECKYFSNPLLIGKHGIEKNLGYGKLNDMEKEMVKSAIPILKTNIKKGEDYAAK